MLRSVGIVQILASRGRCGGRGFSVVCVIPHAPVAVGDSSAAGYRRGARSGVGSHSRIEAVEGSEKLQRPNNRPILGQENNSIRIGTDGIRESLQHHSRFFLTSQFISCRLRSNRATKSLTHLRFWSS
jgi:hypothetical protein